jgi:hypothetical protein
LVLVGSLNYRGEHPTEANRTSMSVGATIMLVIQNITTVVEEGANPAAHEGGQKRKHLIANRSGQHAW